MDLIAFVEFENNFDRLPENLCNLKYQHSGRHVFTRFDGVDGLSADADPFGQLLLGHPEACPLDPYTILHVDSLF